MTADLTRSVFPATPEEILVPPVVVAAFELEETVDAWADAHEHATVALVRRWEAQVEPGRYCPTCAVIRTARYELSGTAERATRESWRVWYVLLVPLGVAAFLFAMAMTASR